MTFLRIPHLSTPTISHKHFFSHSQLIKMKNLTELKEVLQIQELSEKSQTHLKGGGWGKGSKSNGRGCPPPDIMNQKGWMDTMR